MPNAVARAVHEARTINFPNLPCQMIASPEVYDKLEGGAIRCKVCKRCCTIPTGGLGFCFARENVEGQMNNRVYNLVQSVYYDVFEGAPVLSLHSFYCNFRCKFCFSETWINDKKTLPKIIAPAFPFNGLGNMFSDKPSLQNTATVMPPEIIIATCEIMGLKRIVCGRSEPTVNFEFFLHLAMLGKERGIDVTIFTNGYSTPQITEAFSLSASEIVVGIKACWDQDAYDRVVSPGKLKVDVEEILNTILDIQRFGGKYRLTVLVDGRHSNSQKAIDMMEKLKEQLPADTVENLSVHLNPVVYHGDRAVIHPTTGAYIEDQLNVRPGDIVRALELEMELKKMGFKNAHTKYSNDYKTIYGECPRFFPEEARSGLMDRNEKENAGNDIASYVHIQR